MQIQFSLGEIYILYKESSCQKYTQAFQLQSLKVIHMPRNYIVCECVPALA